MAPALTFTIAEAVTVLEPPLSEAQLRAIVVALGWKPAAYRRTGRAGHPWPAYEAADILKLHAALVPFLRIERLLCAWVRAPAHGQRAFTMPGPSALTRVNLANGTRTTECERARL